MSQALLIESEGQDPTEFDRLSDADFSRISTLIGQHAGIKLAAAKRLMVEGRLRKRVRSLGIDSLHEYCRYLFDDHGLDAEFPHLVNAVTTNKTDFFREAEHFTVLEKSLVPALLKARPPGARRKLKLWSAASSNGAEAYTIAMVMADILARGGGFEFAVLGTDISTDMLEAARRAVYRADLVDPVPPGPQQRYIMRALSPSLDVEVRIVPELRRLVHFQYLNLMDDAYPIDRDVDVIFLRNVLIYFDKQTQEAVVRRLLGHLRPAGFLILGHSESMIGSNMHLKQLAPGVFQRD